jgi:hypothetical protein
MTESSVTLSSWDSQLRSLALSLRLLKGSVALPLLG